MKFIGDGIFTKAYLKDDNRVLLESYCPIKRIMSKGLFPKSPLFPQITYIGEKESEDTDCLPMSIYEMEHLQIADDMDGYIHENLNSENIKIYEELKELCRYVYDRYDEIHYDTEFWLEQLERIENRELREVLIKSLQTLLANGLLEIHLEIPYFNLAIKDHEQLILLDIWGLEANPKYFSSSEKFNEFNEFGLTSEDWDV